MLKPDKNELSRALQAAEYMREHDLDHLHLAKTLLYYAERIEKLEKVMSAAEVYLHFGQGSTEHAALTRAISSAKRVEATAESMLPHPSSATVSRRAI